MKRVRLGWAFVNVHLLAHVYLYANAFYMIIICICIMLLHIIMHMHVSNQMLDCAMYSDETSVCRLLHIGS